jgi:hypothetical protein
MSQYFKIINYISSQIYITGVYFLNTYFANQVFRQILFFKNLNLYFSLQEDK